MNQEQMKIKISNFYLIIGIVTLFVTTVSSSCKPGNQVIYPDLSDVVRNNLKGTISKIKITIYDIDSSTKALILRSDEVYEYNTLGFLTTLSQVNYTDSSKMTHLTSYYPNGLTKLKTTLVEGKLMRQIEFKIDSSGKYDRFFLTDDRRTILMYATNIVHNKYGLFETYDVYTPDNKLLFTEISEYRGALLLRQRKMNDKGNLISEYVAHYNDLNEGVFESESSFENPNSSSWIRKHNYTEHDKMGNWITQVESDSTNRAYMVTKRKITYSKK